MAQLFGVRISEGDFRELTPQKVECMPALILVKVTEHWKRQNNVRQLINVTGEVIRRHDSKNVILAELEADDTDLLKAKVLAYLRK